MAFQVTNGRFQALTSAGVPLVGGRLYTYASGTTTFQTTYSDAAATTPNTYTSDGAGGQYIALDARGEAAVWLGANAYRFLLKDSTGVAVWPAPIDGVQDPAALTLAFEASLAASGGSTQVGDLPPGSGGVAATVHDMLLMVAVNPARYGAVGDDSADDTTAFKNALAATVAGRTMRLERGKTYKIASDELVMQDYSTLDLNGATLHFTVTGSKRNLAVGNGCVLEGGGGLITNTAGASGLDGMYQTPVTVGTSTSTASIKHFAIRNLRLQSTTVNGNGIAVLGDCSDGVIENIEFPDSSTLGRGVMCHWSFDGGPTTPYTGITKHPHNIRISNISCGVLSRGTINVSALDQALVFLSACYNVDVSNVYAKEVVHGKGVVCYAGDWGFQFGTTVEMAMGMCGINIRNVHGQYLMGVHVYGQDAGTQAAAQVWPGSVIIDNVAVYGITGDTVSMGARIEGCDSVTLSRCAFDSFSTGVYLGGGVTNLSLEDCSIRSSVTHGFSSVDALAGTGAISIRNCEFKATNTGAGSNHGDIILANVNGMLIEGNKFNSSNATWSVRADNTCARLKIVNNHVYNVAATGPAFSLGSNTDTAICTLFEGNTCDDVPSSGIRGGQIFIAAVRTVKNGSGDTPIFFLASGMPDRGTFSKGSLVFIDEPAVGSPIGYLRLTTGSAHVAGTDWRSLGNLA